MVHDPMSSALLSDDALWTAVASALPVAARTGRPRANDRQTLSAIFFVLESGGRWCDLPRAMGSYVTAWRRYRDWSDTGVWTRVWRVLGDHLPSDRLQALEDCMRQNPRFRPSGVLEGREIWSEPEALEAAIDALVEGYQHHGGVSAVSISNGGLDLSWGL